MNPDCNNVAPSLTRKPGPPASVKKKVPVLPDAGPTTEAFEIQSIFDSLDGNEADSRSHRGDAGLNREGHSTAIRMAKRPNGFGPFCRQGGILSTNRAALAPDPQEQRLFCG